MGPRTLAGTETGGHRFGRKSGRLGGGLGGLGAVCLWGSDRTQRLCRLRRVETAGLAVFCSESMIAESERLGFWTIQSGIFPENLASLALHRKWGFREVGRREKIGRRNGVWRDVVLLERRSSLVD